MGGPACVKEIIDSGRGTVQFSETFAATVDRALSCMSNSVLLGATQATYPTEAMEDEFLAAVETYKEAMSAAVDPLLEVAGRIARHCFPDGG